MIEKSVRLTFANSTTSSSYSLIPEPNKLGELWFRQLKYSVQQNAIVEKDCCWYGWPRQSQTKIIDELNQNIYRIRSYLADTGCDLPMVEYGDLNSSLNVVHSYFENLQGVIWDQNEIFKLAPLDIKFGIRKINTLTHQLEAIVHKADEQYYPWCNVGFMQNYRMEIPEEAFDFFKVDLEFGGVYLHYSQVGKTHFEVYFDNDAIIHRESIHGNRFVTGEFDIAFYGWDPTYRNHVNQEFKKWLSANRFELISGSVISDSGVKHPVGWAKVAQLQYANQSLVLGEINSMDELVQIQIIDDAEILTLNCQYEDDLEAQKDALNKFMKDAKNERSI